MISVGKALQLQEMAESVMQNNEFEITSSQVFSLVVKSACSAYDCEYVSLAEYLDCPLVTQDKKTPCVISFSSYLYSGFFCVVVSRLAIDISSLENNTD